MRQRTSRLSETSPRSAAAMLDGSPIEIDNPSGWPLPESWERVASARPAAGPAPDECPLLVVSDQTLDLVGLRRPFAVVRPPSLVAGVGTSTGAAQKEVARLLADVLERAGLAEESVVEVATIDRRATEPAVLALGRPVRAFSAAGLAEVEVPSPSPVVRAAVGTPSVSEAAALLAAGKGGSLVVTKHASKHATVAVARRRQPRGSVAVVGLGPGSSEHRTAAAARAVRHSEVVIGYSAYLALARDLIGAHQRVVHSDLGAEMDRARSALVFGASGRRVALVCSGDAGVYAMASPVLEIASEPEFSDVEVEIVPGVTASLAAGALLGAPLGHDYATVSLSDLLTPWEEVEARIEAAAAADFAMVLYNPRSARRDWQLERAAPDTSRPQVAWYTGRGCHRRRQARADGAAHDASRPGRRDCHDDVVRDRGLLLDAYRRWADGHAPRVQTMTHAQRPWTTVAVDERCTACGACIATCPERALLPLERSPP